MFLSSAGKAPPSPTKLSLPANKIESSMQGLVAYIANLN